MKKKLAALLAVCMLLGAGSAMADGTVLNRYGDDAVPGKDYALSDGVLTIQADKLVVSGSYDQIVVRSSVRKVTFNGVTVTGQNGNTEKNGADALVCEGKAGATLEILFAGLQNTLTGGGGGSGFAGVGTNGGRGMHVQQGDVKILGRAIIEGGSGGGHHGSAGGGIDIANGNAEIRGAIRAATKKYVRGTANSSVGIRVNGDLVLGGDVTAKGADAEPIGGSYGAAKGSHGIVADHVTIDGRVTAEGGAGGGMANCCNGERGGDGIRASAITVTANGIVKATGGHGGKGCNALSAINVPATNGGNGGDALSTEPTVAQGGQYSLSGGQAGAGGDSAGTLASGAPGTDGKIWPNASVPSNRKTDGFDDAFDHYPAYGPLGVEFEPKPAVVQSAGDLPKTGDPSMLGVWAALLGASYAGLKLRRKK